jgi:hypothetical protein
LFVLSFLFVSPCSQSGSIEQDPDAARRAGIDARGGALWLQQLPPQDGGQGYTQELAIASIRMTSGGCGEFFYTLTFPFFSYLLSFFVCSFLSIFLTRVAGATPSASEKYENGAVASHAPRPGDDRNAAVHEARTATTATCDWQKMRIGIGIGIR